MYHTPSPYSSQAPFQSPFQSPTAQRATIRSLDQATPPPPPPKPNSHETSQRNTPQAQQQVYGQASVEQIGSTGNASVQTFPNPPSIDEGWLPEVVKDKSYAI